MRMRANHTEGKQTNAVGFVVLDTKNACPLIHTHRTLMHAQLHALFLMCVLGERLAEAEMIMNVHFFVGETGKLADVEAFNEIFRPCSNTEKGSTFFPT